MRVIAGRLGGLSFSSPSGHKTHPMSERMRGALFNVLGDIEGLTMLDAFAGSGAVGFEAASRGAKSVVAVEADRAAQSTIADNIKTLGLSGGVKLIKANVAGWLNTSDEAFDLVVCDPPYDAVKPQHLTALAERVNPGGVVVFSLPPDIKVALPPHFQLATEKEYGDAKLVFYRRDD